METIAPYLIFFIASFLVLLFTFMLAIMWYLTKQSFSVEELIHLKTWYRAHIHVNKGSRLGVNEITAINKINKRLNERAKREYNERNRKKTN